MRKLVLGGLVVVLAGCGGKVPQPLSGSQFIASSGPDAAAPPRAEAEPAPMRAATTAPAEPLAPTPVSTPALAPLPEVNQQPPATSPASGQTPALGHSGGEYMIVGAVVAEANGHPIYADRVLADLELPLKGKAALQGPAAFKLTATDLIRNKVMEHIADELECAAADRNLADEDKRLADLLTVQWRTKQIADAGGAEAVARRRYIEQGTTMEEVVRRQSRAYLVRLYYERKILPQVQVSADDMRRYYDANLDKQFTEHDAVHFRLIKVDIERSGGKDAAVEKIASLYKKAQAGEDFTELAGAYNSDDKALMEAKGDRGWIEKGAYAIEEIEKAAWALQVGQVSNIVETPRAFYLVKLEDRRQGRVRSFEEESVQDQIRQTLRNLQLTEIRTRQRERLQAAAVIRFDDQMMESAVAMAMQKYATWTRK